MGLSEDFNAQPWASRLARRKDNFLRMLLHFESFYSYTSVEKPIIVETGTAHDEDNFEGQGQSTLIFDWFASTRHEPPPVISIDLRPQASEIASKYTTFVNYMVGDSIHALDSLREVHKDIGLLYLDSYDWSPELNLESAWHHMAELTTVWSSLPAGCMVVVDDRHGDMKGKHWMVEAFMQKVGAEVAFKNHQVGWVKG